MKTLRAALVVSILLSGCSRGPFLLMAGGKLDGDPQPAPAAFALPGNRDTIQIETRPADPYSVNVSGAVVGGKLYVSSGGEPQNWAKNIEANPLVRARIDGSLYDLKARRVTDRAELEAFSRVWLSGNTFSRDPMQFAEVWVYNLEPR